MGQNFTDKSMELVAALFVIHLQTIQHSSYKGMRLYTGMVSGADKIWQYVKDSLLDMGFTFDVFVVMIIFPTQLFPYIVQRTNLNVQSINLFTPDWNTLFFYKNVKFWVEARDFLNFPTLSPKILLILRYSNSWEHS